MNTCVFSDIVCVAHLFYSAPSMHLFQHVIAMTSTSMMVMYLIIVIVIIIMIITIISIYHDCDYFHDHDCAPLSHSALSCGFFTHLLITWHCLCYWLYICCGYLSMSVLLIMYLLRVFIILRVLLIVYPLRVFIIVRVDYMYAASVGHFPCVLIYPPPLVILYYLAVC